MNKCHCLGLNILILTNIVHSYVLFTANIDDVRKLARKFASESLADKITDFVARITQQLTTNVSEENEMNGDNFDKQSDREAKIIRNIGRQGYEKTNNKHTTIKTTVNYDNENNHAYEMVINERPNKVYDYKGKMVHKLEENSKLRPIADKENEDRNKNTYASIKSTLRHQRILKQRKVAPKKRKQRGNPKLKSKPTNSPDKRFDTKTIKQGLYRNEVAYNQKHKLNANNKELEEIANRETSTLGYAEKFLNEDQYLLYSIDTNAKNSLKSFNKNQYILASADSYDIQKNKPLIDLNNTIDDMQKLAIDAYNLKRASIDLTTVKERTEFDQYDNKNYPKFDFVATSGPVALPKLPTEKPWWERAMPNENLHRR